MPDKNILIKTFEDARLIHHLVSRVASKKLNLAFRVCGSWLNGNEE
jgi:hypothetical protein